MPYPCISYCSQCGKAMPQFHPTKKFCSGKCRQKSYRIANGLPLTWKPDHTKRKVMIGAIQNVCTVAHCPCVGCWMAGDMKKKNGCLGLPGCMS